MAWKAFLESINENQMPDNSVVINVKYVESVSGKTMTNNYTLQFYNFKDKTAVDALISAELQKLNDFDSLKSVLTPLVGKELAAKEIK
jgi:hypothetical protein